MVHVTVHVAEGLILLKLFSSELEVISSTVSSPCEIVAWLRERSNGAKELWKHPRYRQRMQNNLLRLEGFRNLVYWRLLAIGIL